MRSFLLAGFLSIFRWSTSLVPFSIISGKVNAKNIAIVGSTLLSLVTLTVQSVSCGLKRHPCIRISSKQYLKRLLSRSSKEKS